MDIEILKNFMKIAEKGSICKAAEALHMSQPPLSRQLKSLEDELGIELFERSANGVKLTNRGHLLYSRAASLIAYNDLILHELSAKSNIIRLGVTTSLIGYSLEYIKKYRDLHSMRFELSEKNTFELLELLRNNIVDVIFIRAPFDIDSQFAAVKLDDDCLVAVGDPKYFSMPEGETISLHDLNTHPVITARRWKNFISSVADADKRTRLDYDFICDDNRTALAIAYTGMGIAILPKSIIRNEAPHNLAVREIDTKLPLRSNIYMVYPTSRELSKEVRQFVGSMFVEKNIQANCIE